MAEKDIAAFSFSLPLGLIVVQPGTIILKRNLAPFAIKRQCGLQEGHLPACFGAKETRHGYASVAETGTGGRDTPKLQAVMTRNKW